MQLIYLAAVVLALACLPDTGECHAKLQIDDSDNDTCVHEFEDCPDPALCCPSEGNNVGLAFGLTIGAGFATNIGALLSLLPCFKRTNVILLSVGLALAAGLMVYVSFIEILSKADNYFCCETPEHSTLASTCCFFAGILLTLLLQLGLDQLQKLDMSCCTRRCRKRVRKTDEEIGDRDANQRLDDLEKTQTAESEDGDAHRTDNGTNSTPNDDNSLAIGVCNVTAVEGKGLGETAFDSTAAESEIVDDKTTESNVRTYLSTLYDLVHNCIGDFLLLNKFLDAILVQDMSVGVVTIIVCLLCRNAKILTPILRLSRASTTLKSWICSVRSPSICTKWVCLQVRPSSLKV